MELNEYLPAHLEAGNSMLINSNKSSIIFGANGIGKSSIYRKLQENDEYHFIDYDDTLNGFKKSKKKVSIAANIMQIEEISNSIDILRNSFEIKRNLKVFGITTQAACFRELKPNLSTLNIDRELSISENAFIFLSSLLDELGDKFYKLLYSILVSGDIDLLENEINMLQNEIKAQFLNKADAVIFDNTSICPLCDSEVTNLKERLNAKRSEMDDIQTNILSNFIDSVYSEDQIREITSKILNLEVSHIVDYLLSGNDYQEIRRLNGVISEINELENALENLIDEKERVYNILKNYENNIVNDIALKFSNVEINFDDATSTIDFIFERDVKTYSTGELNYILFNVKMYEFFGSDKTMLIIDDILTSYDEINQYALMYMLIRMFGENRQKKFICFTHNLNTIKIANNQFGGFCKMYLIDQIMGKLYLFDFNYNRFNKLINFDEAEEFESDYIKLLEARDVTDTTDERHNIFHYDESFTVEGMSNDYFVEKIMNFENINIPDNYDFNSFKNLFEEKIELFLALRVYLEKVIWENSDNTLRHNLKGKTLGEKVAIAFPGRTDYIYGGVDRTILMSKKVMLNDVMHIENRVNSPFEYIFNLKASDIEREINSILVLANQTDM